MLYCFSLSPTQQKANYRLTNRMRLQFEKRQAPKINKILQKELNECTKVIRNSPGIHTAIDSIEKVITERDEQKLNFLEDLWIQVGKKFYDDTLEAFEKAYHLDLIHPLYSAGVHRGKRIRRSRTFLPEDPWINSALNHLEEHGGAFISQINETSRKEVKKRLMLGQLAGDSLDDIAKQLENIVKPTYANRAKTIARTETCASSNKAGQEACKHTGFETEKAWYSSPDSKTRDQHSEMDANNWLDIDELFEVGGELMAYPGDSGNGASAANIVNCRCAQLFRLKK